MSFALIKLSLFKTKKVWTQMVQTDKYTDSQTKHKRPDVSVYANKQIRRQTNRHVDRIKPDRQLDQQTDMETIKETDKQTYRQDRWPS